MQSASPRSEMRCKTQTGCTTGTAGLCLFFWITIDAGVFLDQTKQIFLDRALRCGLGVGGKLFLSFGGHPDIDAGFGGLKLGNCFSLSF